MAVVAPLIPYIMAASSVYALGSGIKNENWLQAAMGAMGVYGGLSSLGTTASGVGGGIQGAEMAELGTEQSAMIAEQGMGMGEDFAAANLESVAGTGLENSVGMMQENALLGGMDALTEMATPAIDAVGYGVKPEISLMDSVSNLGTRAGEALGELPGQVKDMVGKYFNPSTGESSSYQVPGSELITMDNIKKFAPMIMKGVGMYQKGKAAERQQDFVEDRYRIADERYNTTRKNVGTTVSLDRPGLFSRLDERKEERRI